MEVSQFFPMWAQLTPQQQETLSKSAVRHEVKQGTVLHSGTMDCIGLLLVCSGQLRAYILSDGGKEITAYRLFERDICLLSASCMLRSIQFDIFISAEKDTRLWIIPPQVYQEVMGQSAALAGFTNEIMASRFSDVMWLLEQVMWRSFDKRLAAFLLEEAALENSACLKITHEAIGNHLGNPREVVTRMLRYFQGEGMVKLSRGSIEITDEAKMRALAES